MYQGSVSSHVPHGDRGMGVSLCTWQLSLSALSLLAGG